MTPKDLLATADVLAGSFLGTSPLQEDDIDSLVNKRLVIVFFFFFFPGWGGGGGGGGGVVEHVSHLRGHLEKKPGFPARSSQFADKGLWIFWFSCFFLE